MKRTRLQLQLEWKLRQIKNQYELHYDLTSKIIKHVLLKHIIKKNINSHITFKY